MSDARRSAPAALRNREPIALVLENWLPELGTVLEVASGTGEHATYFAARFPQLTWQPSDINPSALASIRAWRDLAQLTNLKDPIRLDAAVERPSGTVDAILCINMAHISPWAATRGLLRTGAAILSLGSPLIFYGPWLADDIVTAPSNEAFDEQLRTRDPTWGIRRVEDLQAVADTHGFALRERRIMPANNMMLLLRKM